MESGGGALSEKSSEEVDLVERSHKKVKIIEDGMPRGDSGKDDLFIDEVLQPEPKRKIIYRDKLKGAQDVPMEEFYENDNYFSDEESDGGDDNEDDECPTIRLS